MNNKQQPELRPWLVKARSDLDHMRRLAGALPLAESLRCTVNMLNSCRLAITVTDDGKNLEVGPRNEKEKSVTEIMAAVLARRNGARILAVLLPHTTEKDEMPFNHSIRLPSDSSTLSNVLKMNQMIQNSHNSMATENKKSVDELIDELGKGKSTCQRVADAREKLRICRDISTTSIALDCLAKILTSEDLQRLNELFGGMLDRVNFYRKMKKAIAKALPDKKRVDLVRMMANTACPEALALCREQYETKEMFRTYFPWFQSWTSDDKTPEMQGALKISVQQEVAYLKSEFPGLYNRMMKRLTREEQTAKSRRNTIRSLIRDGVPYEFIASCLRSGIRRTQDISFLHCSEVPASFVLEYAVKGNRDPEKLAEFYNDSVLLAARSADKTGQMTEGNHESNDAPAGRQTPECRKVHYEELLLSIKLSMAAEKFALDHGFSGTEIVFSICKGFNFGKRCAAVGNAHFRGVYIRKNISNIKRNGRRRKLDPDEVFNFLRAVGLLTEFGSGPSTKTKDEALAINPHPKHAIGKDIIRTLNGFFHRQKKGIEGLE